MKHHLLNRLAALMTLSMLATWPLDSSATPILSIDPPSQGANVGDNFLLNVTIADITDLFAYQFDVAYDPTVLAAQSIMEGVFLSSGGDSTVFLPGTIDNIAGSPYKSMQVDFYQRVTGIGTTNKNLQVNAS